MLQQILVEVHGAPLVANDFFATFCTRLDMPCFTGNQTFNLRVEIALNLDSSN
jgi:hypothetical protein